jgi:hypothetical protein
MLETLGAGLGSKLAERWVTVVLSPAFAFWAGGLVAVASDGGDERWRAIDQWIADRPVGVQLALAVGALIAVVVSGLAIQRLSLGVIRMLEGYWPVALEAPRRLLTSRWTRRLERAEARYQQLRGRIASSDGIPADARRLAALELRLRRMPSDPRTVMPTALGNRLRAAEQRPQHKYGLDAVRCWPQMWLLLPDNARGDIGEARAELDGATAVWTWGALFIVWTPWAWWAPIAALAVCSAAYGAALRASELLGTLVEAAFDLYRGELYRALGLTRPSDPVEERLAGRDLTRRLWRGSDARPSWPAEAGSVASPADSRAAASPRAPDTSQSS